MNTYLGNSSYDRNLILILLVSVIILSSISLIDLREQQIDLRNHQNHQDTITTPLPGNCPDCGYPDCGGCGGQPQITLQPTEIIPTIPGFIDPPTPDIPDPTQFPTTFPTFEINGLLPTSLPTIGLNTAVPTLRPPNIPPSPVPVGQD